MDLRKWTLQRSSGAGDILPLTELLEWLKIPVNVDSRTVDRLYKAAILWAEDLCRQFLFHGSVERRFTFAVEGLDLKIQSLFVGEPALNVVTGIDPNDNTEITVILVKGIDYDTIRTENSVEVFFLETYSHSKTFPVLMACEVGLLPLFIPENIQTAALLKLSALYNNRDDRPDSYDTTAENLLTPYKYYLLQ